MENEELKERLEGIKKEFTYSEKFSKTMHFQSPKIWEKNGKFRIYVPRNAYEQAGFITTDEHDVRGYNSGEYLGFYYQANRPGNVADLKKFIKAIKE